MHFKARKLFVKATSVYEINTSKATVQWFRKWKPKAIDRICDLYTTLCCATQQQFYGCLVYESKLGSTNEAVGKQLY